MSDTVALPKTLSEGQSICCGSVALLGLTRSVIRQNSKKAFTAQSGRGWPSEAAAREQDHALSCVVRAASPGRLRN